MVTEFNKARVIDDKIKPAFIQGKAYRKDINHIIVHNLRGVASNIKMLAETLLELYIKTGGDKHKNQILSMEDGLELIKESSSSLLESLSGLMQGLEQDAKSAAPFQECNVAEIVNGISSQLNGF